MWRGLCGKESVARALWPAKCRKAFDFLGAIIDLDRDRSLQRPLKQRNRNPQRNCRKHRKEKHVAPHRRQRSFFQQQAFEAIHRVSERIHSRNRPQPPRKRLNRITDPLGKNSSVFRMPNMARGTSGSSIRTISKNIMVLNASEVSTIITSNPTIVCRLKIVPTPASSDPITQEITPVITALIAPARFNPNTSSSLVIGASPGNLHARRAPCRRCRACRRRLSRR